MTQSEPWRPVYEFWFPPGLDRDAETHGAQFKWWFGGGSNAELARFAPLLARARRSELEDWAQSPKGRLSLIIVLDQFSRGLFGDTAPAYENDAHALRLAEEGLANGHYAALAHPWERLFAAMPLTHSEGPLERHDKMVALTQAELARAPAPLRASYERSVESAHHHREIIVRFGRYPHRNAALGRASTPEEMAYIEKGDFPHTPKAQEA
ncbi:MAG: DUF924 family protein [Alphaproteobacteria bacterium]|nr:DUF924 family protein [Alphaproteobacteria bacterium]